MNRIYFTIPVMALLFASCGEAEAESSTLEQQDEVVEVTNNMERYVREDGAEVFPMTDGKEMIIQSIDGATCDGQKFNEVIDESSVIDLDTLVQRRGDSLVFTTYPTFDGIRKEVVLVNELVEGDVHSEGFNFTYQGVLGQLESWVVFAKGFEQDKTILIDKYSGKQTELVGMPIVSPDKRFVLVGNADQEVGFTENHLSLYKWDWDANQMELLVKAPLDQMGWAPYEVVWTDDYHFTIKQGRFNEKTYGIDYSCAEVTIE